MVGKKRKLDDFGRIEAIKRKIESDLKIKGFKDFVPFNLSVYTEDEVAELYVGPHDWVGQYVAGSIDSGNGPKVLVRPWHHLDDDGKIDWFEFRKTILHELGHGLWELLTKPDQKRWRLAAKKLDSRWPATETFADDFARFVNGEKYSMELPDLFSEITGAHS